MDPCLRLMDPDPDPAVFFIDLQDSNKKLIKKKILLEGIFTSFVKDKKSKRSHKTVGIKVFLNYFCLIIEGSGSVPLTNGSGSRRPKNIRIRRIRIRNRTDSSFLLREESKTSPGRRLRLPPPPPGSPDPPLPPLCLRSPPPPHPAAASPLYRQLAGQLFLSWRGRPCWATPRGCPAGRLEGGAGGQDGSRERRLGPLAGGSRALRAAFWPPARALHCCCLRCFCWDPAH